MTTQGPENAPMHEHRDGMERQRRAAALTARQREVLRFVQQSQSARGYPPTLREISARFGFAGPRAAEKHLQALERKGRLTRGRGARAIGLPDRSAAREVPIVGRIAAGRPMLAEENLEGTLALDPSVARESRFLLRVKGESMRDAGILDGDLVLVQPQPDAESGQIVAAMVDGEATVKRLLKKPGAMTLKPENPSFQPLVVEADEGFRIVGKVVGVFRF